MSAWGIPAGALGLGLGACMGSFVCCAAWRYARGETFPPRGRSRCDACGNPLAPRDLVPLVSWLVLRGRCRACGAPISLRCPATELLGALLWGSCSLRFGMTLPALELALLLSLLLGVALTDRDTLEIPDGPLLAGAVLFLFFLPAHPVPLERLRSGLLGAAALGGGLLLLSLFMDRLLGRESMGGGDLKLLALLGLYTGPVGGILLLVLASLTGLAVRRGRTCIPFAPSVFLAAWVTLLGGEELTAWYLGLFGGG